MISDEPAAPNASRQAAIAASKLAERLEMIIDAAELPNASRQAAIAAAELREKYL